MVLGNNSSESHGQHSFRIKHDEKFFSRLISKENSLANPSFRIYYGVASGSVPFMWELQPGKPKATSGTVPVPPLTPPPSYFNKHQNSISIRSSKASKSNSHITKQHTLSSPINSSSIFSSPSSSTSSSNYFSPCSTYKGSKSNALTLRSMISREQEDSDDESPATIACCGILPSTGPRLLRH